MKPHYKRWDEATRKVARDDPDEKMGRVVPDEMSWYEMILARQVPEPVPSTGNHKELPEFLVIFSLVFPE